MIIAQKNKIVPIKIFYFKKIDSEFLVYQYLDLIYYYVSSLLYFWLNFTFRCMHFNIFYECHIFLVICILIDLSVEKSMTL